MTTLDLNDFRKSNIKEVRSKKENEACASGPTGLASRSASPSGTSSPGLLPSAKEGEPGMSCRDIRTEIMSTRRLITLDQISYARLSLLTARAQDHDGNRPVRLAVNMDCSFNNSTQFQKFKWRLTNKRSEFYANIPQDWISDMAYGSAWEYYNELTDIRWIGKATYRLNRRDPASKMKLVPLAAIVLWTDGDSMKYRFWIEDAEVAGNFDINSSSQHFVASSEPIRNFQARGFQMLQL
jgi:hypothetical protein